MVGCVRVAIPNSVGTFAHAVRFGAPSLAAHYSVSNSRSHARDELGLRHSDGEAETDRREEGQ